MGLAIGARTTGWTPGGFWEARAAHTPVDTPATTIATDQRMTAWPCRLTICPSTRLPKADMETARPIPSATTHWMSAFEGTGAALGVFDLSFARQELDPISPAIHLSCASLVCEPNPATREASAMAWIALSPAKRTRLPAGPSVVAEQHRRHRGSRRLVSVWGSAAHWRCVSPQKHAGFRRSTYDSA